MKQSTKYSTGESGIFERGYKASCNPNAFSCKLPNLWCSQLSAQSTQGSASKISSSQKTFKITANNK